METKKKKYPKVVIVPVTVKMWSNLRQIAFDDHRSVSELTREGMTKIIERYQKNVD